MADALHIAVAEDEEAMGYWFKKILPELGHKLLFVAKDGHELIDKVRATPPDLIFADIRLPGLDGIDACERVYRERPTPFILVSAYFDPDLIRRATESHAMSYLVKPIEVQDLRPAISLAVSRFRQFEGYRREVAEAKQALEDRKLIERAKGIVARRLRIEEPDAYQRLQKLSSSRNNKLIEVARMVVAANETFHALEKLPL